MTQERILFKHLGVMYFDLKTDTVRQEDKKVVTHYYVIWYFKYGYYNDGLCTQMLQEISKEEYDFLYDELLKERAPTI